MGEIRHWWAVDVVREHVKLAAEEVGSIAAADFASTMEARFRPSDEDDPFALRIESPLEAIFYVWWEAIVGDTGWFGRTFYLARQMDVEVGDQSYRIDFVLGPSGETERRFAGVQWPLIAIEVDGHAFHERTKEQVAYRNQRDRALQQAGWTVLHFSWTEMTTRPQECVEEVFAMAHDRYWAISKAQAAERAAVATGATIE